MSYDTYNFTNSSFNPNGTNFAYWETSGSNLTYIGSVDTVSVYWAHSELVILLLLLILVCQLFNSFYILFAFYRRKT